jgi:hypothetical protein
MAGHSRAFATTQHYRKNTNEEFQELGVGELQGAKFKIEPIRRVGEDDKTKRARLICTFSLQSHPSILLCSSRD